MLYAAGEDDSIKRMNGKAKEYRSKQERQEAMCSHIKIPKKSRKIMEEREKKKKNTQLT